MTGALVGGAPVAGEHAVVHGQADLVLMAVGQEYPAHPVDLVAQIGDIGNDQVNAEHVRFGKHQAAVDDDDILAVLEGGHVQPDLPETAEGDEPEPGIVALRFFHRKILSHLLCGTAWGWFFTRAAILSSHRAIQSMPGVVSPCVA